MIVTTQLMRYFILFFLTLFLQCFAMPNTVQSIGEDDSFQSFKTRRVLSDSSDTSDKTTFFVVFTVGLFIIIALAAYSCRNGCCVDDDTDPDASATVHPPPRHLTNLPPQVHVPPVNPNFAYDNASYTVQPPVHQPGFRPPSGAPPSAPPPQDNFQDKPPDYATVAMSDLSRGRYGPSFPEVPKTKHDSPPPNFNDNSHGFTYK